MVKIYDGFIFDNEFELLELRLQEHWDYIHKFILVESKVDHRNQPKPLYYADNRSRFAPWSDKIRHVVLENFQDNGPWEFKKTNSGNIQEQQRNMIPWGSYDADKEDILLICDVDEIWRREALQYIIDKPAHLLYSPKQMMSHFKLNFVCKTYETTDLCHGYMSWSKGIQIGWFKDCYNFDATCVKAIDQFSTISEIGPRADWQAILQHGGWHFSWWGDWQDHIRKLDSYGHIEQDTLEVRELMSNNQLISSKLSDRSSVPQIGNLFPEHDWTICEVDDYYPNTITSNLTKYRRHILPNPSGKITDFLPQFPLGSTGV